MAPKTATPKTATPKTTRLDSHVDAPSITAPGDGPADTTDPTERASTVGGDKAAAAAAGHLTVNAAVPTDGPPTRSFSDHAAPGPGDAKERTERYKATRPDGSTVTVQRNMETGESTVSGDEPGHKGGVGT